MATWYQSLASRSRQTSAHVWQPRNTSSVIFSKGLLNAPGENNCFLNSAVQVLWHLDVFRRSFREMGGHACMGKACIFCALKVLFTQLRYSEQQSLPPDALRKALAVAFKDEFRFQLGCMDDAAECFENILTRIHFHLAHEIKEELCDAKHCIPHRKFAMTLIEHSVCLCGATSEPFPFTQMVHYVSCTALCAEAKKLRQKYSWSSSICFGQVLRSAGAIGDIRDCPSDCGKKISIRRVLMNCPDVVAIGLVWDSDQPDKDHIVDVIQCLGTSLRMPDLFNSVVDDKAKQAALNLVGVVTYYGKHYSTFFYNTARRLWVYFDDATVKQVGPNWRDVVNRCKRGHSQPLLLLFANPDGTPVSTETAPEETTLLPDYSKLQVKSTPVLKPSKLDYYHSSITHQPLQPVKEYEEQFKHLRKSVPVHTSGKENKDKDVNEIGHDALRTIQSRGVKGQILNCTDKPPLQRRHIISDNNAQPRSWLDTQGYSDLSTEKNIYGMHEYSGTPSPPANIDIQRSSKLSQAQPHNADSLNKARKNNIKIPRQRGVKMSNTSQPKHGIAHNVTGNHCQYNHLGQVFPPRKLERHESWSGRPSHLAENVPQPQSQRYIEKKNSFSFQAMPKLHHQSRYGSVPDLQRGIGSPHDIDSVASKDSGYRSRDRFSASSGSVYSFEAPGCCKPYTVDSEENWKEHFHTQQVHRTNSNQTTKMQDMNSVCDKVCSEVADLRYQSRKMEDDGDLATALALCTAIVTKLKDCQNLPGISAVTRQSLHTQYNNDVLQSRSLYRRLTLLQRQDTSIGDYVSHPNLQQDCRQSKSSHSANGLDLIDLHTTTLDTSHVDRLKQQLQKLYIQKANPQQSICTMQCAQEVDCTRHSEAPTCNNTSFPTLMQGSQKEAIWRTNSKANNETTYREGAFKETLQDPDAFNDLCIPCDWYPNSHTCMTAEKVPVPMAQELKAQGRSQYKPDFINSNKDGTSSSIRHFDESTTSDNQHSY